MPSRLAVATAIAAGVLPGCRALSGGFEEDPSRFEFDATAIAGYLTPDALSGDAPKSFLSADLMGSAKHPSELLSFDLWPLFGFGAGSEGVRARLLALEGALGTGLAPPKAVKPEVSTPPAGDATTQ
jgi:hypothetical protein